MIQGKVLCIPLEDEVQTVSKIHEARRIGADGIEIRIDRNPGYLVPPWNPRVSFGRIITNRIALAPQLFQNHGMRE